MKNFEDSTFKKPVVITFQILKNCFIFLFVLFVFFAFSFDFYTKNDFEKNRNDFLWSELYNISQTKVDLEIEDLVVLKESIDITYKYNNIENLVENYMYRLEENNWTFVKKENNAYFYKKTDMELELTVLKTNEIKIFLKEIKK